MQPLRIAFATLSVLASLSLAACGGEQKKGAPDKKEEPKKEEPKAEAPKPEVPPATPTPAPAAAGDIVATATAAGGFSTLLAAATAADLVSTLQGPGPFTVFAPNDEAFAKIPKADLDALLADKEKLKTVLLSHVVAGKVLAADVTKMADGAKVATVSTKELTLGLKDGKVSLNGSNVIKTDIAASNGVIHVIDTVIIPQ